VTLYYLPSLVTFCLRFLKFTQVEAWLLEFIPAKTIIYIHPTHKIKMNMDDKVIKMKNTIKNCTFHFMRNTK